MFTSKSVDDVMVAAQAEAMQREINALLAWSNTFLGRRQLKAAKIEDFSDGVLLINLLEVAYGKKLGQYNLRPKFPAHKLDNISLAMDFMRIQHVTLISLSANDIVQEKPKPITNLLWNLLRALTLKNLRVMSRRLTTGGAESDDSDDEGASDEKAANESVRQTLLNWTAQSFQDVPTVQVRDFWESFQDGIAFCGIVEKLAPGNIKLDELKKENAKDNLELAFRIAEQTLGIPSLLQPEDFGAGRKPDEKTVENYVCMLVSAAQGRAKTEAEVTALREKMDQDQAKKVEEVQRLKDQVDEEKRRHEALQADVERLQQLHQSAFNEQNELQSKLQEADTQKSEFMKAIEALQRELTTSHENLMAARQREQALLDKQSELEHNLDERRQVITTRDAEIDDLKSEVYRIDKELNQVIVNMRSEMKEAAVHERSSSIRDSTSSLDYNAIMMDQQRESKSYTEFLNAMPTKSGWLMKRRPGKDNKKMWGNTKKKRYFECKGDTLYYYKEKGGALQGKDSLRFFSKIKLPLPGNDPDSAYRDETKDKDDNEIVLKLEPRDTTQGKPMELSAVQTNVPDMKSDVYSWIEELNTRIALIQYLDVMFNSKSTSRYSRELVDFVTTRSMKLLKLENRSFDQSLINALDMFKETFIMRQGLSLSFINAALPDSAIAIIKQILMRNNTIESLEFPRNLITDVGAKDLAAALESNTSLRTLNLEHNNLKDAGVTALAQVLAKHKSLTSLNLINTGVTDRGIEALMNGLVARREKFKEHHLFPHLSLSKNMIGDDGARAIARLIEVDPSLLTISLDNNLITDAGVEVLCNALRGNHVKVQELSLAGNHVSSAGMKHFAALIKAVARPIFIDLSGNPLIASTGIKALVETDVPVQFHGLKFVRVK